jgi:hypothetical protein
MNFTPTTLDREDTYPADQNGSGRGRHAHPASEYSTGRARHARPSRARRYLVSAGVAVVGGAAIVTGVLVTSSHTTGPAVPPAATHSSGPHTANPAVPSRPDANPAVPSHPGAAS